MNNEVKYPAIRESFDEWLVKLPVMDNDDWSIPYLFNGFQAGYAIAADDLKSELQALQDAANQVIKSTRSHIDGRSYLDELHPRKTLDIKRRVDGVEIWYEGDWLSGLRLAVQQLQKLTGKKEGGE